MAPKTIEPLLAPVVVNFAPSEPAENWFVSGLEEEVKTELLRFHTLEVAKKVNPGRCPGRDPRCLLEEYRAAGVQVIVLGNLGPRTSLRYDVYETWTGSRAFDGSFAVSGVTTPALEREIDAIVRRIVQRGGLLDQRPAALAPEEAVAPTVPRSPALPRPTRFGRLAGRAAAVAALSWPTAAGMLWGAFGLTIGVWVFAPIHGLERIRHDAVWPLLRSWTILALLRAAALAALYVPVFALTRRACAEAALPERATWAIALPVVGLLTYLLVLALVDGLSVYLDSKLVLGPPTPRNPWHATIKRYFRGYVRRNVVPLDERLLERTLFLPGTRPGVVVYGGGFGRPRIVVGEAVLTAALGELPEEEEIPDRNVNPEDFPVGVVAPSMDTGDASHEPAEEWRRRLTAAPPRARAYMPRLVGQNATLLGWVLPQPIEEGIPLISDTEEDFGVVKRLLSEHYAAFQGANDDEVDDTDPSQKDFLFGALLRELGVASRRDVIFATLSLSLDVVSSRTATPSDARLGQYLKNWLSHLVRLPLTLYERLLAAPAIRVADAYPALNGALDYFIQYLCIERGVGEELLTARANVPRLLETSRRMLAELDRSQPTDQMRDLFHASRDRAAWLARIFQGPVAPRRFQWMRVVGAVAITTLVGALILRSVLDAIAYHPIYVGRMSAKSAPPAEGENTR